VSIRVALLFSSYQPAVLAIQKKNAKKGGKSIERERENKCRCSQAINSRLA